MFWVLLILISISVGIYSKRDSKAKVASKAFGAMLYMILDHSISEINFNVGFSSPSYFTKCYKTQFGNLPTEVRDTNN